MNHKEITLLLETETILNEYWLNSEDKRAEKIIEFFSNELSKVQPDVNIDITKEFLEYAKLIYKDKIPKTKFNKKVLLRKEYVNKEIGQKLTAQNYKHTTNYFYPYFFGDNFVVAMHPRTARNMRILKHEFNHAVEYYLTSVNINQNKTGPIKTENETQEYIMDDAEFNQVMNVFISKMRKHPKKFKDWNQMADYMWSEFLNVYENKDSLINRRQKENQKRAKTIKGLIHRNSIREKVRDFLKQEGIDLDNYLLREEVFIDKCDNSYPYFFIGSDGKKCYIDCW